MERERVHAPLLAFVVAISEYDGQEWSALPGAQVDAIEARDTISNLGFEVSALSGHVKIQELKSAADEFIRKVEDASQSASPIVLATFSSHGVQVGAADEFPVLVTSDCCADLSHVEEQGYDVRNDFVARLNRVKSKGPGNVRTILVLDCCRENDADRCWKFKGTKKLPSLRNDFWILFACDPGRKAVDLPSGGAVLSEFLRLLWYAKPINDILQEVQRRVYSPQRPWVHIRAEGPPPVLGIIEDGFPAPISNATVPVCSPNLDKSMTCTIGRAMGSGATAEERDEAMRVLNIVLVGQTGVGKSTLANSLTGATCFEVSDGFNSCTRHSKHADIAIDDQMYRIVDTVGFSDTCYSPEENFNKFSEFADLVPGGIDLFVFVIKRGRVLEKDTDMLGSFYVACGEDARNHTVVAFSAAGDWKDHPDFKKYCIDSARSNAHLSKMLELVGNVIPVESCTDAGQFAAKEVVLNEARRAHDKNCGRKYDNVAILAARRNREYLVGLGNQIRGCRGEQIRKRINEVYNGTALVDDVRKEAEDAFSAQANDDARQGAGPAGQPQQGRRPPEAAKLIFDAMEAVGSQAAEESTGIGPQMFVGAWNGLQRAMRGTYEAKLGSSDRRAECPRSEYSEQLSQLREMGCTNEDEAIAALSACNGDVQTAIDIMFPTR